MTAIAIAVAVVNLLLALTIVMFVKPMTPKDGLIIRIISSLLFTNSVLLFLLS